MKHEDFDKIIGYLERLKLVFFGKTVDFIAKILVITGISMMSSPLIVLIINAYLEKNFDFSITEENDVLWGFMLILLSLIFIARDSIFNYLILRLKQKRWEILIPKFSEDFQNLNLALNNYTFLFNEYTTCISNKGNGCASKYEKERVKYDEDFFSSVTNIEIVLGKNITKLFMELRKIMSKSFLSEIDIYNELSQLGNNYSPKFRPYHISDAAKEIYYSYFHAVKEINECIIKTDIDDEKFDEILDKNNLNRKCESMLSGLYYEVAQKYIIRRNDYI